MNNSWKDSIYQQREALAEILRAPLAQLAEHCVPAWGQCDAMDAALMAHFSGIPHCSVLYCMSMDGLQLCNNVGAAGIVPGHVGRDRSQRPYMKESVPIWGFLLSDAYIGLTEHRPSLTALQVVSRDGQRLGYLGAAFDLRNLPVTSALYEEPGYWRQVKGDPAIRGSVFQQCRVESPMDGNLE